MPATLKIGPLPLTTPVLSAPVAGFSDRTYRMLVREFGGCGLLFTEMVSASGWIQGTMPPERLAGIEQEARPLGVQLWDREPGWLEQAARRLAEMSVSVIDLNFGCPKKRIMGKHAAGATLLRDPATVGQLVAATVRGAGTIPVTAKMRLGPSIEARTARAVARSAADHGAAAITVHGRTADEHYGVPCRFDLIGEVVESVAIPVIANGDITDAGTALRAMRESGAAGVMVAREALTRPWVFREITAALRGEPIPAPPSLGEQRRLLLRHHAAMVEREGDERGTILMRKFAVRYLNGLPGSAELRNLLTRATCGAEFRERVDSFHFDESEVQTRALLRSA